MKHSRNIPILLLSFFSLFVFVDLEVAYTSVSSGYETQIFKESNESKVKKLQEVFRGLELYIGEITGNFIDIEKVLIDYQKSRGIIVTDNDEGAGYFGPKTMEALEKEFGEKYLQLKEQFLRVDIPSEEERYFQITAYYSPLPNQKKYETGSYAGDVRLNGEGTSTASGNGVYPGLLAAPRNYSFGTKIYLEGIGIGEVGDRGGAIVNSGERGHEYDRLDIWVGFGDEGRERASKWGRRNVKGFIVSDNYEVNVEFDESKVAKYSNLKINPENPDEESVRRLQTLFSEIGLYDGEIDGDFVKVKDILINYQLENGVISSLNDSAAGYFGTKTFAALQKNYGNSGGLFVEKYIDDFVQDSDLASANIYSESLTASQRQNMNLVKIELEKILEKIYEGDLSKIMDFKTQFKIALTDIANSRKYSSKKGEFLYLVEIL